MIPNPTRLTKIVRKMMRSGRVTSPNILYNQREMGRSDALTPAARLDLRIIYAAVRHDAATRTS